MKGAPKPHGRPICDSRSCVSDEHTDSVALYDGEQDENHRLQRELRRVLGVMWRIVNASTRLTCITAGYGWFTIIAPILVAVPGYFSGDLSFALMMVVGAFMQVQGALRWFIDNFGTIADWRATLLRIATFRETLLTMDALGASAPRIKFVAEKRSSVAFENLQVATPTGCTMLSEQHVEIAPGDRVLIVGEPGAGKTLLFQAIAGLWPWGSGKVALPASNGVTFVPRQPYVPLGTLRAALAYPSPENTYKDEELVVAVFSESCRHVYMMAWGHGKRLEETPSREAFYYEIMVSCYHGNERRIMGAVREACDARRDSP
jgi:vitamin B12/bleomycin/antimicrobial peptide transport system ATP-binding/permease protein